MHRVKGNQPMWVCHFAYIIVCFCIRPLSSLTLSCLQRSLEALKISMCSSRWEWCLALELLLLPSVLLEMNTQGTFRQLSFCDCTSEAWSGRQGDGLWLRPGSRAWPVGCRYSCPGSRGAMRLGTLPTRALENRDPSLFPRRCSQK